jgi:ferrochelatase
MNLGGPDRLEAVRPFLINLFSDPAIIRLPGFARLPLARIIAWRRASVAREIYRKLGGGSPLLANTEAQARALEEVLGTDYRCFVAMRYWHPTSDDAAHEVAAWGADRIVCLPLYPQFSTTTTASSLTAWNAAAARHDIDCPTHAVCCYPCEPGFVEAAAELIRPALNEVVRDHKLPRLLLTAHGLPKKIAEAGEPYRDQIEATAAAIIAALNRPELDWTICYQSRVGPLEWIGPATDEEIRRAAADQIPVVVAPISFVSEHSETLVELDIDYRDLSLVVGVPAYKRVRTVGTHPSFINSLAALVHRACDSGGVKGCGSGVRFCAWCGAGV